MPSVSVDTRGPAKVAPLPLTDEEIGLIEDGLQRYRDSLASVVECFHLGEDENLPPAPGGILATMHAVDRLLLKLGETEGLRRGGVN